MMELHLKSVPFALLEKLQGMISKYPTVYLSQKYLFSPSRISGSKLLASASVIEVQGP